MTSLHEMMIAEAKQCLDWAENDGSREKTADSAFQRPVEIQQELRVMMADTLARLTMIAKDPYVDILTSADCISAVVELVAEINFRIGRMQGIEDMKETS